MKYALVGAAGLVVFALAFCVGTPVLAAHSDYGCSNCHTPHHARSGEVPLWSPKYYNNNTQYTLYDSPTLDADVQQPTGASRLCLSCHDGSYDHVDATEGEDTNGSGHATNLGTDLSNDHPISFNYDAVAAADEHVKVSSSPAGIGAKTIADILDTSGMMQCSTCHDVHESGLGPNLLRWDLYTGPADPDTGEPTFSGRAESTMCRTCHDK